MAKKVKHRFDDPQAELISKQVDMIYKLTEQLRTTSQMANTYQATAVQLERNSEKEKQKLAMTKDGLIVLLHKLVSSGG